MTLKTTLPTISLILATLLTGCTTNPYTGESEPSKTGLGVGIGAATGALAGQLIGRNATATLIGATAGALVGGVTGNVMDRQAAILRDQLRGTGVSVILIGHEVRLVMPGDITFAVDSANIKSDFYRVLNSVALVLKEYKGTMVHVDGYTDNTGTAPHNQTLSQERAQSVATYLISQGVDSRRFEATGHGRNHPVASNSTADGRAKNRRVEITLRSAD